MVCSTVVCLAVAGYGLVGCGDTSPRAVDTNPVRRLLTALGAGQHGIVHLQLRDTTTGTQVDEWYREPDADDLGGAWRSRQVTTAGVISDAEHVTVSYGRSWKATVRVSGRPARVRWSGRPGGTPVTGGAIHWLRQMLAADFYEIGMSSTPGETVLVRGGDASDPFGGARSTIVLDTDSGRLLRMEDESAKGDVVVTLVESLNILPQSAFRDSFDFSLAYAQAVPSTYPSSVFDK